MIRPALTRLGPGRQVAGTVAVEHTSDRSHPDTLEQPGDLGRPPAFVVSAPRGMSRELTDPSQTPPASPRHARSLRGRIRARAYSITGSEESVYGTILVTALIAATDEPTYSPWDVVLMVLVTVVIYWAAHVYARTIAGHGVHGGHEVGLRSAIRESVTHTVGLLTSTLIPVTILLLGGLTWVPDAVAITVALWSGVGILFVHGFVALLQRRKNVWYGLLGGVVTASFGVVIIVLKMLLK